MDDYNELVAQWKHALYKINADPMSPYQDARPLIIATLGAVEALQAELKAHKKCLRDSLGWSAAKSGFIFHHPEHRETIEGLEDGL
jgi:hypothetical protein